MLSLTNAATDFRRLQVVHSACQEEDEKKEKGKRELLLHRRLLILYYTNKHHYRLWPTKSCIGDDNIPFNWIQYILELVCSENNDFGTK